MLLAEMEDEDEEEEVMQQSTSESDCSDQEALKEDEDSLVSVILPVIFFST